MDIRKNNFESQLTLPLLVSRKDAWRLFFNNNKPAGRIANILIYVIFPLGLLALLS
ncbi:hypothetical protein [Lentilactobacillus farraginis]|uniref:Uncharacterized protein n=1 Tax=Lentilactobacillus farraginis DSM 18382 = JCM 14108 TaxID=1423743 RepID=X0PLG8_9LACO|nr:hypothetical protein [Lentilactobacillus farraginis]KRM05835.1 hypothetical protein FD41_GL000680 [Lentilactobacillus farraginis DSM 18382 = JCM 14108]GAF37586.1 hypothetical protein JCM14108_2639 [Lentilactobacillus farraginis DSM 18382 = JCM 14108]